MHYNDFQAININKLSSVVFGFKIDCMLFNMINASCDNYNISKDIFDKCDWFVYIDKLEFAKSGSILGAIGIRRIYSEEYSKILPYHCQPYSLMYKIEWFHTINASIDDREMYECLLKESTIDKNDNFIVYEFPCDIIGGEECLSEALINTKFHKIESKFYIKEPTTGSNPLLIEMREISTPYKKYRHNNHNYIYYDYK